MPAQQRVRRRNRGHLTQGRTPNPVRPRGQASAIVIREAQSPRPELASQEPVFFDQVGDRFPFSTPEPAGQHQQHQAEGRGIDNEAELILRADLKDVSRIVEHYGLMHAPWNATDWAKASLGLLLFTPREREAILATISSCGR